MRDLTKLVGEITAACITNANKDSAKMVSACVRDHKVMSAAKPVRRLSVVSETLTGVAMSIQLSLMTGRDNVCIGGCAVEGHEHDRVPIGRALTAWQVLAHAFTALLRDPPTDDDLFWGKLAFACVHEIEDMEKRLKQKEAQLAVIVEEINGPPSEERLH
jgi:hypothetical protein